MRVQWPSVARWASVAARWLLAYLLLASCWNGQSVSGTAFAWVGSPSVTRYLGTPAQAEWLSQLPGLGWIRAVPHCVGRALDWAIPFASPHALGSPAWHLDRAAWYWRNDAIVSLAGMTILPWVLSLALGTWRASDLGLRLPTRAGWTALAVAYLVALPGVVLMALQPGFKDAMHVGGAATLWFPIGMVVSILAEHYFFHGILLAWLHPRGKFPAAEEVAGPWELRWGPGALLGLLRSASVPWNCLPAIVLSAPLFFAIHTGKADPEYWLSLPAGAVFAWIAYRTNGPLVPMILHLATGATAGIIGIAIHGW